MATLITAHSGCDGTPDNSIAFLNYALASRADALEIDVHPKPGGGCYLSHDSSDGDCPDLEDAFRLLAGSRKKMNCDLKQPNMELAVLALAKEFGVADRILFSGDVNPRLVRDNPEIRSRTLLNLKPIAWEMLQNLDRGILPGPADMEALVSQCRAYKIPVINVPFKLCTDLFLDVLEREGIGVSAWTVNDTEEASRLLAKNIFNITTRNAAAVCALR